ncbi:bactofilin BacM [Myxococcus sp. CA051A]|uniref:Bactofilin BacM n=1 Tax=Myxococcus llanfairpwllgwyngyllgogerychwyrndrobwllllantysiliogogogochensis TaxID=2590453 RepID=A0A540X3L1_9BACT|nr:bactofilin BacM [Myxococcus llanfairpwllgwyngyllgogerychwyrndrobwllllantysiliogogogochensis]NTX05972.1 bactofilin BacM [Myxococcus sp. CA040A]NTX10586.1 bactofilin BacM [Myxococcus sp. CA056]NTX38220.1 bactofilin BacM [Myxococcus sp. CA033]NTX52801.1 bactofilin BacM [Myxococcus sp. CA039A]NTX63369.1 bactofilin BacM [Myxococcus sp. CA051A]
MALLGGKKDEAPSKPLFKREEESVSQRSGEVHTLLGKGSEFEGKLTFEGQVRIDGKFQGQIITKDVLVIGDGAKVNAEIQAGTVIINGQVEGNVKATQIIELKTPGRVKGNLETPSLSMDRGVVFEGTLKMENLGGNAASARPPPPGGESKK